MTVLLELITGSLLPYLVAAAGGLAVLAGAYFKGRRAGKKAEIAKRLHADQRVREASERIENEVAADSDAAVRERLRRDARR